MAYHEDLLCVDDLSGCLCRVCSLSEQCHVIWLCLMAYMNRQRMYSYNGRVSTMKLILCLSRNSLVRITTLCNFS